MHKSLEQAVRERARGACEYCRLPEYAFNFKFPIDHIIALQHGGATTFENLALACGFCNAHKGPNVAGIDRPTGNLEPLFNPRLHHWKDHFLWQGPRLFGITGIGRVTVGVLAINHPVRVRARQALLDEGRFPPPH
jgi:hypothetical protein